MFNPFRKVFPSFEKKPIKTIEKEFKRLFPNAINVEWAIGPESDEAIFYQNEQEFIARFDKKADLIDYKINLDIHTLPDNVRHSAQKHGEIMNAIAIYKESGLDGYEIIFRDTHLTRFTMLTSASGTILSIQLL
ncbi:MAG: hypothetical protein QM786_02930 [Breznakibacter sp.]